MPEVSPILEKLLEQVDQEMAIITLVRGVLSSGKKHFAYALIKPSRYMAFKQAEAAGNYNLADYGEIIEHGDGLEPSDKIRKSIEAEYGANHRFEEELMAQMDAFQMSLENNK